MKGRASRDNRKFTKRPIASVHTYILMDMIRPTIASHRRQPYSYEHHALCKHCRYCTTLMSASFPTTGVKTDTSSGPTNRIQLPASSTIRSETDTEGSRGCEVVRDEGLPSS